ncbi:putative transcriptional activator protein acu-15 protein [Zalerion maritima]|uniref:Transcriptional activator protein acu-15 protein n=1 Tax=Zalerion maritima TaxID=339359 RepID=A0AAD5RHI4_9PEZI|nr:putative transcriptional activator protein acu-15 protein [Zalerion maritima]
MPGILPMKVIKVGTSSQSRIAQACDRCRSKKIRCDGMRPTCSQCANVGFECRTSDRLSRRAFPRGYTESLEERVRQLEAEVRELKDLLDEKDEKIDMLSKMHGNRRGSISVASSPTAEARKEGRGSPAPKEDTFRVQASPLLLGVENSDSYFMGASSGRAFIESFKRKIQECGKSCSDFNLEAFLHIQGCYPLVPQTPSSSMRIPPRLFSDKCVNVYFQEWAPLFPVLHKPTFLRVYEEFVADPEKIKSSHKVAQLYLVFSIAGLSIGTTDMEQLAACEVQWQKALESILMDNTMHTLQCLVLALMYCTVRADYKRLQHYKGIAVGLSHRLGLHQSQKRFSFGALTIETRKKVFWTLYTLDCFSGAILGLPKLLKEDDIHAEYPSDTDDEYVTEKGFQPTLPGEYTRLSSALALFRASRILAKVLDRNYPAATSHEISLQQMSALEAELDDWSEKLPQHLKLNFVADKPSTDITGSRSPLLSLAYYYIKTLIFRPAVGSSLGSKAAPALISVGDSSKHIIQIVQLLEERNMSFSFCLNRSDVLVLCGMTLLYQCIDLKKGSKTVKDNERLVNSVIKDLDKVKAPGSYDFKRVSGMLITLDDALPATKPSGEMAAPSQRASPPASLPKKKASIGRNAAASVSETDLLQQQEKLRRMTMPNGAQHPRPRPSFDSLKQDSPALHIGHRMSMSHGLKPRLSPSSTSGSSNLDYLNLSHATPPSDPASPAQGRIQQQQQQQRQQQQQQHRFVPPNQHHLYPNGAPVNQKVNGVSISEWETLLGSLDGGSLNVYDAIYGGPQISLDNPQSATSSGPAYSPWSPDSWDLTNFNIGDFGGTPAPPQSVLSVSDESLSSGGEERAPSELGLSVNSIDYRNNGMIPPGSNDGFLLDGLDGNFGL